MFILGARSESRLIGVHKDLQRIVRLAIKRSPIDFTVTEGVRTLARQRQLVASGASRTMNSRHLNGFAVDLAALVNGKVEWAWPLYGQLNTAMQAAAHELGLTVEWGGNWRTFKDGPHWQLPHRSYPDPA